MVLPTIFHVAQAVPASMLSKAFREGAEGFVKERSKSVTIEEIRRAQTSGKSVHEGLGMAEPNVQAFLINAARRCPWLLDEITFEVVAGWVAEGNPALAVQVLSDPVLMMWGARTWAEGVAELKRLAGIAPPAVQ